MQAAPSPLKINNRRHSDVQRHRRAGSTVVEMAFVGPVTFMMIIGILVGGFGVYRYQQVARLSQEAARWMSVRGSRWQNAKGLPAPTAEDVLENAIIPNAAGLNPNQLRCQVEWSPNLAEVIVVVEYDWTGAFLFGDVTFSNRAIFPVMN